MRKYSSKLVDGKDRAPSRSMLRAVGFKDKDFNKPQVGIASTWSMVTPCNMHINDLAKVATKAIDSNGGKLLILIQLQFQTEYQWAQMECVIH